MGPQGFRGSLPRARLAGPRRALLRQALADGITAGELLASADPDVLANLLIGSFYARYLATSELPQNWPHRALGSVWPDQPPGTHASPLPSASRGGAGRAGRAREGPGAPARPGAGGLVRGSLPGLRRCGWAAGAGPGTVQGLPQQGGRDGPESNRRPPRRPRRRPGR